MQNAATVHIYQGSLDLVGKSGVGQAARHQAAALQSAGVQVVGDWQPQKAAAVHINTVLPVSLLAARRAKRRGEPVVWYGHSTMEDFRHSFTGSDLLAPLFKKWLCLCYAQADLLITPTPYAARILRGYGLKMPIRALSNGVDTDFFAPSAARRAAFRQRFGLAQTDKVIISVGHYMQRKGILDFIALARSLPSCKFFWFGYTEPALVPRPIRAAMAAAPANLQFPGYLNQADLRDAYCGADIFAFCSHEETEGIVVLEALACGTPTVVRDIPVYAGWLQDGENVYKAATRQEFRRTIQDLLHHTLPDVTPGGHQVAAARALPNIGAQLVALYPSPAQAKPL